MRRILKWIGGVIGLLVLIAGILYALGSAKLNKAYDIEPDPVTISMNAAALERGQYLYSSACAGCHGDDLGGAVIFDDPALGTIVATNLTAGGGGIGQEYSDVDLVRAIRHGVDNAGKPLAVMPSQAGWYFSDADVAAIIAYLRNSSPMDSDLGQRNFTPLAHLLLAAGIFDILSAESIDHDGQRPAVAESGATADYGEYMVNIGDCRNCHGDNLAGAQPPEPGAPASPNLTPGGAMTGWKAEAFINTMRTGVTPMGRQLDSEFMPWESYGRLSDEDLTAIFLFLQSVPAQETTN